LNEEEQNVFGNIRSLLQGSIDDSTFAIVKKTLNKHKSSHLINYSAEILKRSNLTRAISILDVHEKDVLMPLYNTMVIPFIRLDQRDQYIDTINNNKLFSGIVFDRTIGDLRNIDFSKYKSADISPYSIKDDNLRFIRREQPLKRIRSLKVKLCNDELAHLFCEGMISNGLEDLSFGFVRYSSNLPFYNNIFSGLKSIKLWKESQREAKLSPKIIDCKSLDMRGFTADTETIETICSGRSQVESLSIYSSALDAQSVAKLLCASNKIKKLNLGIHKKDKNRSDIYMKISPNHKISSIYPSHTKINPEVYEHLISNCSNIKEISAIASNWHKNYSFRQIKSNVKSISILGCDASDYTIMSLFDNHNYSSLESLFLASNNITDKSIKLIASSGILDSLVSLKLAENQITDQGIKIILDRLKGVSFSKLCTIHLSSSSMSLKYLEHVKEWCKSEHIELSC